MLLAPAPLPVALGCRGLLRRCLERPAAAQWSGSRIPTDIVPLGRDASRPALASAPQLPVAAGRGASAIRGGIGRRRAGEPRLPRRCCPDATVHLELQDRIDPLSTAAAPPSCRFCGSAAPPLRRPRHVAALRELRAAGAPRRDGAFYPLHVRVCGQLPAGPAPRLRARRRRSSRSTPTSPPTRTAGSRMRATTRTMAVERFGLDADSLVVELASNDGYLLQHFVERGIPRSASSPPRTSRRRRGSWASRPCRVLRPRRSPSGSWPRAGGRPRSSPTTCSRRCRT